MMMMRIPKKTWMRRKKRLANMPIISHKRPHKLGSVVSGAVSETQRERGDRAADLNLSLSLINELLPRASNSRFLLELKRRR